MEANLLSRGGAGVLVNTGDGSGVDASGGKAVRVFIRHIIPHF
jgi:hypothetical protein